MGPRIIITRSDKDCSIWSSEFERLGFDPIALPCINSQILEDQTTTEKLERCVKNSDWLVFTSVRGIEAFKYLYTDTLPKQTKIACIGPSTAQAADDLLGHHDFVSPHATATNFATALLPVLESTKAAVTLVLARNAPDTIEQALTTQGLEVHRVNVYQTIPSAANGSRRPLSELQADSIVFASPTAVTGFLNQFDWNCEIATVSIGPTTSAALIEAGLPVTVQASTPSISGIIDALKNQA